MLLLSMAVPGYAWAQRGAALERNLPPAAAVPRSDLTPVSEAVSGDAAPLGIDVKGVRVFGLAGRVAAHAAPGIAVDGVEGVSAAAVEAALAPFLGEPLSQKLVAEARAAVVAAYRDAGRPFVSVTVPPQEVTGGVLQLQAVPYRLGDIKSAEAGIGAARLRAREGQFVDATQLSDDIDWLNRFPFRQINGVFEPGSRPGETDLTLTVTRQKPWRVYGGYSNTGSQSTGHDRYFVGFAAGIEALNDLSLSYQLTGSENFWAAPARGRLAGQSWPQYISHAGRIILPTFARQAIEIAPNFVATRQETIDGVLSFRNTTFELPVIYRSALSNLWAGAPAQTEIYGGVAMKWSERHTAFGTINLARGDASTFSVLLGVSRSWRSADGASNSFDIRFVGNPGGVLPGNTARAWNAQTNGRVDSVQYGYFLGELTRSTPLNAIPALDRFSINTNIIGLAGWKAMPDTEQLSLGGAWATRGYSSSDGAVDAGIVMRNELRLPGFSLFGGLGQQAEGQAAPPVQDNLSPYVFLDMAYGHTFNPGATAAAAGAKPTTTLIGLGAGFDYRIENNLLATLSGGWALKDGYTTRRGDFTAHVRVSVSY